MHTKTTIYILYPIVSCRNALRAHVCTVFEIRTMGSQGLFGSFGELSVMLPRTGCGIRKRRFGHYAVGPAWWCSMSKPQTGQSCAFLPIGVPHFGQVTNSMPHGSQIALFFAITALQNGQHTWSGGGSHAEQDEPSGLAAMPPKRSS